LDDGEAILGSASAGTGPADAYPGCYFFRVKLRTLLADFPSFGLKATVSLSLIDPLLLSAAFPRAFGLSVNVNFPALVATTFLLSIDVFPATCFDPEPAAVATACMPVTVPGPETVTPRCHAAAAES
jgi:hypothetical protein